MKLLKRYKSLLITQNLYLRTIFPWRYNEPRTKFQRSQHCTMLQLRLHVSECRALCRARKVIGRSSVDPFSDPSYQLQDRVLYDIGTLSIRISVFFLGLRSVVLIMVPIPPHSLYKGRKFFQDSGRALGPALTKASVRPTGRTVVELVRRSQNLIKHCQCQSVGPGPAISPALPQTRSNMQVTCSVGQFCQCSPLPEFLIQKKDSGGASAGGGHYVSFRNEGVL